MIDEDDDFSNLSERVDLLGFDLQLLCPVINANY